MKAFNEYIIEWFQVYLKERSDRGESVEDVFNHIEGRNADEPIEDYLENNETILTRLNNYDANTILNCVLLNPVYSNEEYGLDDTPSMQEFYYEMLKELVKDPDFGEYYDWFDPLIEDIAHYMDNNDNTPDLFFKDLANGGCESGMIAMFIYNSDCNDFYREYANEMEEFRESLEDELGERIKRPNNYSHYIWMCWLCYEELAHKIARVLFPDNF